MMPVTNMSTAMLMSTAPRRSLSDMRECRRRRGKCPSVCETKRANRLDRRGRTVTESASDRPDAGNEYSGPRSVLVLYAALVTVAGVAGFLTGTFVEGVQSPRFLFLVAFPPTPLGVAAYGALTVAVVLGLPLALVVYVSRHVDEAEPGA
jgi:hypothetical protein